MFNGGPAKGMAKLVSRNFSDNRPPITVPYLHGKLEYSERMQNKEHIIIMNKQWHSEREREKVTLLV